MKLNANLLLTGEKIYENIVRAKPNTRKFNKLYEAIKEITPKVKSISRYDKNGMLTLEQNVFSSIKMMQPKIQSLKSYFNNFSNKSDSNIAMRLF